MRDLTVVTCILFFTVINTSGQNPVKTSADGGAENQVSVNHQHYINKPDSLLLVDVAGSRQPVPSVNFHPGSNYADINRSFGIASSITKTPGGRLYCGFTSGGTREGHQNYGIVVFSDDDGLTWSHPAIVFDTDGDGPVRSDHVTVWMAPSGELWIMWSQYPEGLRGRYSSLWAIKCNNPDAEDPQWSVPVKLVDEQNLLTTPTVLSNGTWIFPTGNWNRDKKKFPSRPLISRNEGMSFELGGPLSASSHPDFDEYMIVECSDGQLVIFNRHRGSFLQCESEDGGLTWTQQEPNGWGHTNARFVFMKLQSGEWLLVKHGRMDNDTVNALKRGRSHLMAYLSGDEGKTWEGGLLLDERSCSYPYGYQDANGKIYISYERERFNQPEILLAKFTEEDVTAGKVVSDYAVLKLLVNKAHGGHFSILPNRNKDGDPLLTEKPAVLEPAGGMVRLLGVGDTIFSNRDFTFYTLPDAMDGKYFVFSEIDSTKAFCHKPGVVFVLAPVPERNETDSPERTLLADGFVKSDIPEFFLFRTNRAICSVYQKQFKAGEVIQFGQWGVLVF